MVVKTTAKTLTVAIANATYLAFHILEYTNGIAGFEQQANQGVLTSDQKADAITNLLQGVRHGQSVGLLLVMTVLPCVLMFLSYVLYYRPDAAARDERERICGELERRKAKA